MINEFITTIIVVFRCQSYHYPLVIFVKRINSFIHSFIMHGCMLDELLVMNIEHCFLLVFLLYSLPCCWPCYVCVCVCVCVKVAPTTYSRIYRKNSSQNCPSSAKRRSRHLPALTRSLLSPSDVIQSARETSQ